MVTTSKNASLELAQRFWSTDYDDLLEYVTGLGAPRFAALHDAACLLCGVAPNIAPEKRAKAAFCLQLMYSSSLVGRTTIDDREHANMCLAVALANESAPPVAYALACSWLVVWDAQCGNDGTLVNKALQNAAVTLAEDHGRMLAALQQRVRPN